MGLPIDPISATAAGISALTGVVKMFKGAKQNKLANRVVVPGADYNVSPYAQNVLAEAQRLRNSQMPNSAQATQNIFGNQANAVGSIQRNSSSGAQSLALLGGVQGNTNNAFNDLSKQQGQYSMAMLQNSNMANQGMTEEMDKVFQDKLRKRQEAIMEKTALRAAANGNMGGGMNDVTNAGFMYAQNRNPTKPTTTTG